MRPAESVVGLLPSRDNWGAMAVGVVMSPALAHPPVLPGSRSRVHSFRKITRPQVQVPSPFDMVKQL
jgi:hypothetical protein